MPSQPSAKHHGRLATAHEHHMTLPCALPSVVHHAYYKADKVVYESIDCKSSDITCLVKQMRKENVTVVGNKSVRTDAGEMSMSEDS